LILFFLNILQIADVFGLKSLLEQTERPELLQIKDEPAKELKVCLLIFIIQFLNEFIC
jgi:hypothetical protein